MSNQGSWDVADADIMVVRWVGRAGRIVETVIPLHADFESGNEVSRTGICWETGVRQIAGLSELKIRIEDHSRTGSCDPASDEAGVISETQCVADRGRAWL